MSPAGDESAGLSCEMPLIDGRATLTIGTAGADLLLPRADFPRVARQQLQIWVSDEENVIRNLSPMTPCRLDGTDLGDESQLDFGTHELAILDDVLTLQIERATDE